MLIGTHFFEGCGLLRAWLEQEERKAREQVQRRRGRVAWYESRVSQDEVKAVQRKNISAALAERQFDQWAPGVQGVEKRRVLATCMEASVTAYKEKAYPNIAGFLEHCRECGITDSVPALANSFGRLATAEANLRVVCTRMKADVASKASEPLLGMGAEAWVEYVDACAAMGEALREACESFVRWATKDTAKKVRENFPSRHPRMASLQLGIRFAVAALTALSACVSIGIVGPAGPAAVGLAAAALQASLDVVEHLTVRGVANESAKDPETLREHLGRAYMPSQARDADMSKEAEWGINTFYQPLAPGVGLSPEGSAQEAVPFLGQVWRLGGMLVTLEQLVHPRVLQDTSYREGLLKLLDQAEKIPSQADPSAGARVHVLSFDPVLGTAAVEVDGVPGILQAGRFQPKNRTSGLHSALGAWVRNTRDVNPGFYSGRDWFTEHKTGFHNINRFVFLENGEFATQENLAAAVTLQAEIGGGYECTALATGFQYHPATGHDIWKVCFFINSEGVMRYKGAEFQHMEWQSKESPGVKILTQNEADLAWLGRIRENDEALDALSLLLRIFGLGPTGATFAINNGNIQADGQDLTTWDLFDYITQNENLTRAKHLMDQLEQRNPVDTPWQEIQMSLIGSPFTLPLAQYSWVKSITGTGERCQAIEAILNEHQDPLVFIELLQADRDLYDEYINFQDCG
ncbi:hypothetical protein ACFCXT_09595 [Streptomyces vinaceus]|uniref:hypothetical protein n=1 Tax=Streptomyces vinaceus TaxID=1960 RepID=UPI0035DF121D